MSESFYQNNLYPLQDEVLGLVKESGADFYLTGGTALSRCHLHHRYSDSIEFIQKNDLAIVHDDIFWGNDNSMISHKKWITQ